MPIGLEDLCVLRPYLYHLTSRRNAERIAIRGSMESAGRLLVLEPYLAERRLGRL